MTGIITALFVFALVSGLVLAARGDDEAVERFETSDMIRKRPQPGVRDRHATTGTLHHAPVPHFG